VRFLQSSSLEICCLKQFELLLNGLSALFVVRPSVLIAVTDSLVTTDVRVQRPVFA